MTWTPTSNKLLATKVPLVISFSGGRTSAFMSYWLKRRYENERRPMIFVFANTGKERIETLGFVNECDKRWGLGVIWIEYQVIDNRSTFKIVNYETASRSGEPFEAMIAKYGLPNKSRPHCTRELKIETIRRYLRSIGLKKGGYDTAIGIRADEAHRINWEKSQMENIVYPLVTDFRVSKEFVREWWDRQEFDLNLRDYEGNCDMCWKKSHRKLLTMITENPHLIEWWGEMEAKYGQGDFSFFRGGKTATDLIELSKQRFIRATDEHDTLRNQTRLFDYEMDAEHDCFCKSS